MLQFGPNHMVNGYLVAKFQIFIHFNLYLNNSVQIQSEKRTCKSSQETGGSNMTSQLPFHISAGVNEFIVYITDIKTH